MRARKGSAQSPAGERDAKRQENLEQYGCRFRVHI
jgi:hypothetical protein